MTEISCEMCMDLIPLVRDGIASADSEQAVREHLQHCVNCSTFFDGRTPPVSDSRGVYRKLQRKVHLFAGMILLFGLFFGLSLSGKGDMLYNVLLLPILGAIGYVLMRWKALFQVPLLLFVLQLVMNITGLTWPGESMQLGGLLLWTFQYSVFAVLGIVIAGLLHFALRKER